jgi:hypothetical protein
MIQSIARYLIAAFLAYLVGHGVITKQIADANTASMANYLVIAITLVGTILWSYLEKKYKGVLSAYFPNGNPLGRTPPSANVLLLGVACGAVCVLLAGCATSSTTAVTTPTGTQTVSSQLVNAGYEIENFLQEFNTGLSATVPSAETFLDQTHNSGDAQTLALYATLASEASNAAATALKAGLPPQQVQASVSAALAPSNAAGAAANVAATSVSTPSTN